MKTRNEILEETQLFLEKIDRTVFNEFKYFVDKIGMREIDALPDREKQAILKGYPSSTLGALSILFKNCMEAKSTAHGHFSDD